MSARPRSHGSWPSLERQLADAGVTHGSALESLVTANQDFEMLREEEANDQLRLPPWLRVYWRKLHPDADYSGASPSGGYPLVLHDLYKWMLQHQDLTPEAPPDVQDPSDPRPPFSPANLDGGTHHGR